MRYVCSRCGAEAYHDGRCDDGPVLVCGCDRPRQMNDRFDKVSIPTTDARPIPADDGDWDQ